MDQRNDASPPSNREGSAKTGMPSRLVSLASLSLFPLVFTGEARIPEGDARSPSPAPAIRLADTSLIDSSTMYVGAWREAVAGRAQTLRYEKTVQVDADFDAVLRYFAYLGEDKEPNRKEREAHLHRSIDDRHSKFIGFEPGSTEGRYSIVSRTPTGRVLRASLPTVVVDVYVPAPRGGQGYRVPLTQEKFVEIEGAATVKAVTIRSELDRIMEPHWRVGIGPQSTTVRIARGTGRDGRPCTLLTVSSSLGVEAHGLLGRNKIVERARGTFGERCEALLNRNAALLYEKSRDPKVHAGPLEMLRNASKLLEVK